MNFWQQKIKECKKELLGKMQEAFEKALERPDLSFEVYLYEDRTVELYEKVSDDSLSPKEIYEGTAIFVVSYQNPYELDSFDKEELEKRLNSEGILIPNDEDVLHFVKNSDEEKVRAIYEQFFADLKEYLLEEALNSDSFERALEYIQKEYSN